MLRFGIRDPLFDPRSPLGRLLRHAGLVIGAMLILYGIYAIYRPLGVIAAGSLLTWCAWSAAAKR